VDKDAGREGKGITMRRCILNVVGRRGGCGELEGSSKVVVSG